MKLRTDRPQTTPTTPAATAPTATQATTATTTAAPTAVKGHSDVDAASAGGKRFDAHALPPPSTTAYQPQPGKRAALDLRTWQPSQLREAMLKDIDIVYSLLRRLPPAVTFFGGARIKEGDPYYKISQQIGALLAEHGAPIRTGAGPGIMTAGPEGFKAALKKLPKSVGALDASTALHPMVSGMTDAVCETKTQGFRIKLPFEQEWSDSIDVGAEARLFPYRKLALYENCKGVTVFPGGYGTLDELFEVWAHGEAGRFDKPMAAVGVEFWSQILAPIASVAVEGQGGRNLITANEWQKLLVTDDPQALVQHFEDAAPTTNVYDQPPLERAAILAREIDESIAVLDRLPMSVTFLGGRRLADADPTLATATALASSLSAMGVPLRVGSGGVVAEAVCRGAGDDVNVQGLLLGGLEGTRELKNLTVHQSVSDLVTHKEIIGRKSQAFVALPGGLNTLGEVFSVLTQMQTGHLPMIPVVLVGKDYWQPIFDALKKTMLSPERQTISPTDLDLVTITDDPAVALSVMAPTLTSPTAPTTTTKTTTPSSTLTPQQVHFEGDRAQMVRGPSDGPSPTPGSTEAVEATNFVRRGWLVGLSSPSTGKAAVTPDVAFDRKTSKAFVAERLKPSLIDAIAQRGIDQRHVAWALDNGVDAAAVADLVKGGAGPEAFRALYACAPYAAYRDVGATVAGIIDRWLPHSEAILSRVTELSTSVHLQNPDAIKTWLEGLCAPGVTGDAFAGKLADAWALVGAGHRVALNEHPRGRADILDLSQNIAYVHARVATPHLAPTLTKALLSSTKAPTGFARVVHIDARQNQALAALTPKDLEALLRRAAKDIDDVAGTTVKVLLDAGVVSATV